ncbi:MAG TPA: ABC transporter substrate-binding protein [Dehalococcoidales bacterium]
MKNWFLIPLVILLAGVLVFAGCSQSPSTQTQSATTQAQTTATQAQTTTTLAQVVKTETLKIGVIVGLTGPGSQMYLEQRDVSNLAQDWINGNGGITVNGTNYKIQCIYEDNKGTAADSITAATRLISQEGVKFIVGGAVPDQVNAIASVTEKNKVLYETGQTDKMDPAKPLFFAANYSFISPLTPLYDTMKQLYPNIKNAGFIIEDESGARAAGDFSQQAAKDHGLTLLEPQMHPWESTEFAPQWTKLMSLKPDAVDIGIKMPNSSAAAVKQGREAGFTGPMIATTSADPGMMLNMIGKAYSTDFIWPSFDVYGPAATPMVKTIVGLWSKDHSGPVSADGMNGWDQLWILTQAIEKAQSLDPATVAKSWQNMSTGETSRGTAKMGGAKTFGINSMVFRPCPISRLQNGQVEFLKWVDTWAP